MHQSADISVFWKKKQLVSFVLSILVTLIHSASFFPYESTGTWVSILNEKVSFFFMESITRFAVPMFFLLAGAAMFRDYEDGKYLTKLRNRVRSLLIPYLLWNILWMLFNAACSYSFLAAYINGRELFVLTLGNVLRGIFLYGYNTPFWFVFDLIVFSLFAPVIFRLIRHKWLGVFFSVAFSLLLIWGIGLPEEIFFHRDALIYYMVGGILGRHGFSWLLKRSTVRCRLAAGAILGTVVLLKNFAGPHYYLLKPAVTVGVHTLCSLALWKLLDGIAEKRTEPFGGVPGRRPIYMHSFGIFAMNVNVASVTGKLLYLLLPRIESFALVNFVVSFALTLGIIHVFCNLLERWWPRGYALLMGSRA